MKDIQRKIFDIREHKVILDFDLAELYAVQTKNLNLAVKRNRKRFPKDFMFKLTKREWDTLRLQIETSKNRGGNRYLPYAFTEQGLAMLSGILNSTKAIKVNIAIMRAFVFTRRIAMHQLDLNKQLKELELKFNKQFKDIYEALDYLLNKEKQIEDQKKRKRIGFLQIKISK